MSNSYMRSAQFMTQQRLANRIKDCLPCGTTCTDVNTINYNLPSDLILSSLIVNGNANIDGLINTIGLELSSISSNPGTIPNNTLWINQFDSNKLYFGNNALMTNNISSCITSISSGNNILVDNSISAVPIISLSTNIQISTLQVSSVITSEQSIQNSLLPYPLDFYVSKSGNDISGTGSQSNPFLTIQKAISSASQLQSTANPWEVPNIIVNNGLYLESLTITRSINIYGQNFLLNTNAGYLSGHGVRLGDNTNLIFISTPTQSTTPVIRFENIDIRCPITNMESTILNTSLTFNYCNIDQQSNRPNISLAGTGTLLFLSNCNLDGLVSSNLPLYLLSTSVTSNIEECRIQGTTSSNALIFNNGTLNIFNTIIDMNIVPTSGLTNFPLILQDSRLSNAVNANNSQFFLSYPAAKTLGANIITMSTTSVNNSIVTLDQCYFGINNGISTNFIYQNLATNRNVNLNLIRQNSMAIGNNSVFNTNSTTITNNFIISQLNRFRGDIDLNFNNLLNCSTISSSGNLTINRSTGNIVFQNLPTTSVGLPSGSIWNNSGVLSIIP